MYVAVLFSKNNLRPSKPINDIRLHHFCVFSTTESGAVAAATKHLQQNFTAAQDLYTILVGEMHMQVVEQPIIYKLAPLNID